MNVLRFRFNVVVLIHRKVEGIGGGVRNSAGKVLLPWPSSEVLLKNAQSALLFLTTNAKMLRCVSTVWELVDMN
jgi:hypothetical protein